MADEHIPAVSCRQNKFAARSRHTDPWTRVLGTLIAEDALRVAEKIVPNISIAVIQLL
tara:strand:- start:252 stop:425 length:174 start_codon:yes stop_codon:yes gene_type:complete